VLPEQPRPPARRDRTKVGPQPEPVSGTIYSDVARLLRSQGWARGRRRHGDALSLLAAIDAAVGVGNPDHTGSEGAKLARAARIASHLRDLTGTRSLDAWEDERTRRFADVLELLAHGERAFGAD
jgi:hypothetical protein